MSVPAVTGFRGYNCSMFTLFFPEPPVPNERDMDNFDYSLAPQIMLFWTSADQATLDWVTSIVRQHSTRGTERVRVALRLQQDQWNIPQHQLQDQLEEKQVWARGQIQWVLCRNEPDHGWDFTWQSRNWGNVRVSGELMSALERERLYTGRLINALSTLNIKLISPAYEMHGYTEDDKADPGLHTWRELNAPVYYGDEVYANGVHYYDTGWWVKDPMLPPGGVPVQGWQAYSEQLAAARVATKTNVDRFKHAVRFWSGFHHKLLCWDESNTFNSRMTEYEHMEACVGKSKVLLERNAAGHQIGERVMLYSPFASNGLGNAYPVQYIMREHRSYELVRQHMIAEGGYIG